MCGEFTHTDDSPLARARFYYQRSDVLHTEGVGLGFMPIGGIISFQAVSGNELWRLEIYANAALIGFLKNVRAQKR